MNLFEPRGEGNVVPTLEAKRAELAGLIMETERVLTQLHADLAHVDGTIKLFYSGCRGAIPCQLSSIRKTVFRFGELPRLVMDVLRATTHPLDVAEIAKRVLMARNLDIANTELVTATTIRVGKVLSRFKLQKKAMSNKASGRQRWKAV